MAALLHFAHYVPMECHRRQAAKHIQLASINLAEVLAEVLGVVGHLLGHALVHLAHQTHHVHQVPAVVVFVVQAHPHSSTVKRVQCRLDHV